MCIMSSYFAHGVTNTLCSSLFAEFMSSYRLTKCKYGRHCRTKNCRYDHSEAVLREREDGDGRGNTKRARLDATDKKLMTHQKSLSEDDLKVYEVQDLFPSVEFTKINEVLVRHNYDTQKAVEYFFSQQGKEKEDKPQHTTNNTDSATTTKTESNNIEQDIDIKPSTNESPKDNKSFNIPEDSPTATTTSTDMEITNANTTNSTTTTTTTTSTTTTTPDTPPIDNFELVEGDSIQCKICLETKKIDFMFVMQQCGHGFCRDCVSDYFKSKINDRVSVIKCPDFKCKKEATEFDLEMVLDKQMMDKFSDISFQNAIRKNPQEFSCCPTPDCPYIFFYTGSDNPDFGCPTCKKRYCLNCRVAFHTGTTCEDYQKWSVENGLSDDLFGDFVRGHKFKQCARCHHWVEKTDGCNHMTCICEYEFCYKCGGEYADGCQNCADGDGDGSGDEEEYYSDEEY